MTSPSSARSSERRICAGDWVRVKGSDASVRGLGKVIDAEYDETDDSLRLARIEFARGVHWFWTGDIRRILADEELRLCEGALEVASMPEPARDRVKAALISPPRSPSARSLGLLDLLWSLMGSLPGERAVNGLARFFDEGGPEALRVLAPPAPPLPASAPPPLLRPIQRVEAPPDYDPVEPFSAPVSPPPAPRPAQVFLPHARVHPPVHEPRVGSLAVVSEILATLNHNVLEEIAKRSGFGFDRRVPIQVLRGKVRTQSEIHVILSVLTPNQLMNAARSIGLEPAEPELRILHILRRAAPRNAAELHARLDVSVSETRFLVGLLDSTDLRKLASSCGIALHTTDSELIERLLREPI